MTSKFDVTLGNPAHGGLTVARHEGRVVFVHGGISGEVVRVEVTEDRGGSFSRASVIEVISASDDRVEPVCSAAAAGAGCCDLSHLTIDASRGVKTFVVAEQLRRLADFSWSGEVEALPGRADGTRWRTRVRLAVDASGRAGFRRYRGSDVVPNVDCAQPVAGLVDGLAERRFAPDADVVVVHDDDGNQLVGEGRAVQRVAGRRWEIAAGGFWQAHEAAAQTYSDLVADWAGEPKTAWDLFAGAGVFAARLADGGAEVVAVESSPGAVRDGTAALEDTSVRFVRGRTDVVLRRLRGRPEVVVLDPPRKGTGKQVVAQVTSARPHRIIQIGCDPASFARDVNLFAHAGYAVRDIRAFDAFPLTHHVECIALLVPQDR